MNEWMSFEESRFEMEQALADDAALAAQIAEPWAGYEEWLDETNEAYELAEAA